MNVILTSRIIHLEQRHVVYPSYSVYHTVRMNICINKESIILDHQDASTVYVRLQSYTATSDDPEHSIIRGRVIRLPQK
jgi:hypothetical protein